MDYEKKYKEAIERAKIWQEHLYDVNDKDYADELNYIFPELAESEDERVKKAIITIIHLYYGEPLEDKAKEMIAWLEKQSEKKSVPKFEVGDVMRTLQEAADGMTDGMPVIVSIDDEYYHCTNGLIAIKDQDDYEYPPMNKKQPAWSENDEQTFIESVEALEDFGKFELADWLKERKLLFLYGISIKLEGTVIKKIEI